MDVLSDITKLADKATEKKYKQKGLPQKKIVYLGKFDSGYSQGKLYLGKK